MGAPGAAGAGGGGGGAVCPWELGAEEELLVFLPAPSVMASADEE